VAGDDPSVAGRKHVVELWCGRGYFEQPGYHAVSNKYAPDTTDYYKAVLTLNGKEIVLNEEFQSTLLDKA
jgi:hypothetical protein